jgi:tetratricopeptide (TPR) repeat protein
MPLRRIVVLVCTALAITATSGSLGFADEARVRDQAFLRAKSHAKEGDRLYDLGEYRLAAAEYREAYELLPLPDILFNLAQAYRLSGDAREAVRCYRRFLELADKSSSATQKAKEHLDRLIADHGEAAAPLADPQLTAPEAPDPGKVAPPLDPSRSGPVLVQSSSGGFDWMTASELVGGAGALILGTAGMVFAVEAHNKERDVSLVYSAAADAEGRLDASRSKGLFIAAAAVGAATVLLLVLDLSTEHDAPLAVFGQHEPQLEVRF